VRKEAIASSIPACGQATEVLRNDMKSVGTFFLLLFVLAFAVQLIAYARYKKSGK
jgi:hypothetical protein